MEYETLERLLMRTVSCIGAVVALIRQAVYTDRQRGEHLFPKFHGGVAVLQRSLVSGSFN